MALALFFFMFIAIAAENIKVWNAAQGMILLSTEDNRLACGFSTVLCPKDSKQSCLVFSIFYRGSNGGALSDRVVWAANRESPVLPDSPLELGSDGNLVLKNLDGSPAWSSNTSGAVEMKLKDSGNLVLVTSNGSEVWGSFDHPSDTLLPGQSITSGMILRSSVSTMDSSLGKFTFAVEPRKVTLSLLVSASGRTVPYGLWKPRLESNSTIGSLSLQPSGNINLFTRNGTKIDLIQFKALRNMTILYLQLDYDGSLRLAFENSSVIHTSGRPLQSYALNTGLGLNRFKMPSDRGPCNLPLRCGEYGICNFKNKKASCDHETVGWLATQQAGSFDSCRTNRSYTFLVLKNIDYFLTHFGKGQEVNSSEGCKRLCLENCFCRTAFFKEQASNKRKLCYQISDVFTLFNSSSSNSSAGFLEQLAFFKVDKNETTSSRRRSISIWIPVSLGALTIVLLPLVGVYVKKIRDRKSGDHLLDNIPGLPRRFSFQELRGATGSFKTKLGSGAFGTVYRGLLEDGTKVAVKRLESGRHGCDKQFRAEVVTIASVRHANLVRLTGFCSERRHTLLVYEFMPNGSLDKWIFRHESNAVLSWKARLQVALDIARGLAYLHEGCEQAILHLDIKPQNILLDANFRAKISDFGLSISTKGDCKSMVATMMRGTPGYMAPEWLQCRVSPKMDVYSFGMVLLELVSGMPALELLEDAVAKPGFLMQQLQLSNQDEQQGSDSEVERATQVALCCIQEDASTRPAMGSVVKMLEGSSLVPSASMVRLKHLSRTLPMGIASFLARSSHSADNGFVRTSATYESG